MAETVNNSQIPINSKSCKQARSYTAYTGGNQYNPSGKQFGKRYHELLKSSFPFAINSLPGNVLLK